MDFGELQLDDAPPDTSKERRFSVHDVDSADNEVSYGQPDNLAMEASGNAMRIASVDDASETTPKQSTRAGSVTSDSNNEEEENANVFIHENVDNTYDEYAAEPIVDEYNQSPQAAARGSKEATPEKNTNATNEEEEYPSHYRHPSLAAHENPVSDDEDLDKDHNRYSSTLIHDTAEDDSDYETTPAAQEEDSNAKSVSRLYDYWCHSSSGIAIEDDTDAKVLPDKVDGNNHNIKGSVHEMNNYTRPFMSKIESNDEWDNAFGHGIISDTHEKYRNSENGQFIEWVIEVNNMCLAKNERKSSVIIGISSDLLGEINEHSDDEHNAFVRAKNGFGFDNLGNVYHDSNDLKAAAALRTDNNLYFESRDVVHIILDYSDSNNWIFYAKVGDIEYEYYKDLEKAATTNKITKVFDKINPGSYRLAVALYSQMNALIIESCKIHGNEKGSFYQELKSYSSIDKESENKEEEEEEEKEEPINIARKMTVIVHNDREETEAESRPSTTDIVPIEEEEEEKDEELDVAQNIEHEKEEAAKNELAPQKSFIVHDEEDSAKIAQQTKEIERLKEEIETLRKENEEKEKVIASAQENQSKETQEISELRASLNEYREKAESAKAKINEFENKIKQKEEKQQQEITQLNEENERLNHELKLAQDRLKSLNDKKQEMQSKLNNAIETKMKLIIATSEEIDHYRKLIQQIAQNKLGCKLLSDLQNNNNNNNNNNNINGRNGYY